MQLAYIVLALAAASTTAAFPTLTPHQIADSLAAHFPAAFDDAPLHGSSNEHGKLKRQAFPDELVAASGMDIWDDKLEDLGVHRVPESHGPHDPKLEGSSRGAEPAGHEKGKVGMSKTSKRDELAEADMRDEDENRGDGQIENTEVDKGDAVVEIDVEGDDAGRLQDGGNIGEPIEKRQAPKVVPLDCSVPGQFHCLSDATFAICFNGYLQEQLLAVGDTRCMGKTNQVLPNGGAGPF